MNSQIPVINRLAELASEVVHVMNNEQMAPTRVGHAVSIVLSKANNGFGEGRQIQAMVEDLLQKNPGILSHLHHNARHAHHERHDRPMSGAHAQRMWEEHNEQVA